MACIREKDADVCSVGPTVSHIKKRAGVESSQVLSTLGPWRHDRPYTEKPQTSLNAHRSEEGEVSRQNRDGSAHIKESVLEILNPVLEEKEADSTLLQKRKKQSSTGRSL